VALRWLKRRGAALIDEGLSESSFVARRMLRSNPQAMLEDRALGANVTETLYKAGYWADALACADRYTSRSSETDAAGLQLLRVIARIYGKAGATVVLRIPYDRRQRRCRLHRHQPALRAGSATAA
jgi:hypothetical protein